MPRPKRPRHIFAKPQFKGFSPDNAGSGDVIILTVEEFETIRLIDYQGMDQSQAAEMMSVSRQTVGRILKTARLKTARALVEGRSLNIRGGCYRMRGQQGRQKKGGGNGFGKGMGRRRGRGSGRPDTIFPPDQQKEE